MKVSEKAYNNALLNLKECEQKKVVLSSYPLKLYVEPTVSCNLCCSYCYAQDKRNIKPLDMKIFYALEKQMFEYLSEINLFLRGEPTLYKNFAEMLDVCSKYPFIIKFFSNLSYKIDKELLKKIVEVGSWVNVSFDGLFFSMRNGTNVEQIVENIKFLKSVQKQINQDKFHLRVAVVVGKNNVNFLRQVIEWTNNLEIKEIMLGCIDGNEETSLTSEDAQKFDDAVVFADKIKMRISTPSHVGGKKLKKTSNWHDFSLPVDKYFEFYCEESNPDVENKMCSYPWIQTVIKTDGEVVTCCQGKKHIGYFTPEKDFIKDIWNNEEYQKLRSLKDFSFCGCNIMKYSIWGGEQQVKNQKTEYNFSLIIPYKESHPDRKQATLATLGYYSSFVKQHGFEIIVTEQGTQPTLKDVSFPIRYFFLGNSGDFNKSWGMNIGALKAKYDTFVFCDCDILISIGDLVESVKKIGEYDAVNPMGNIYDLNPGVFKISKQESLLSTRPHLTFASSISIFKKEAFLKVRGWDEEPNVWGVEDDVMSVLVERFMKNITMNFDVFHIYHTAVNNRVLSEHNCSVLRKVMDIRDNKDALMKRYKKRLIGNINKFGRLNLVEIDKTKE